MKKWIFTDYDGTINTKFNDIIEPEDIKFIQEWVNDGNEFVINTGRIPSEVEFTLKKNNLKSNYILSNNGTIVYEIGNGVVHTSNISRDSLEKIRNLLEDKKDKLMISYTTDSKRKVVSSPIIQKPDPILEQMTNAIKIERLISDFDSMLEEECVTSVTIFGNKEDVQPLYGHINSLNYISSIKLMDNAFDIVNHGFAKHSGIEYLQGIHKFEKDDVYVFGDGPNDADLLKYCDNSFAIRSILTPDDILDFAKHEIKGIHEVIKYIK